MGGIFELCCGGKDPVYTDIEEAALGAYDTISKVDIIALKGSDFGNYERNDIIKSIVDVKRTLVWMQRCVTSNDQLPSAEEAHELKEIFDEYKVYSALMDVTNTNSNDKLNEALMTITIALNDDFMQPKNWWLYGALPKWGELPDWNELKPKLLDELGSDLVKVLQG